jgi:hypothetical protein
MAHPTTLVRADVALARDPQPPGGPPPAPPRIPHRGEAIPPDAVTQIRNTHGRRQRTAVFETELGEQERKTVDGKAVLVGLPQL